MNVQELNKVLNCLPVTKQFFGGRRGVAGIEFALIAPILVLIYLGLVEITMGIGVNKNPGRVTSMVADLVTQQATVSTTDLSNIMQIGQATLLPY